MAKRATATKTNAADLLQATGAQAALPAGSETAPISVDAQTMRPAPKRAPGASKAKRKATVRDDEEQAEEEALRLQAQEQEQEQEQEQAQLDEEALEGIHQAQGSHGADVLLAQARDDAAVAPSSVGEDLLRQAGPLPSATTSPAAAAPEAGFFSGGFSWPVALGAGVGVLALASGGGSSPPAATPTPEGQGPAPVPYSLTVIPMAGKFTAGAQIQIFKNGTLFKTLNSQNDGLFSASGQFSLKLERSELASGDVLQLVLTDANIGTNYRDPTTNQAADLGGVVMNAWAVVPGSITDTASLTLAVTPLTQIAHLNLTGGVADAKPTAEDIVAANNSVAKEFGLQVPGGINVDLVHTAPISTLDGGFRSADPASQAYGQTLARISSLAFSFNSITDGASPTPGSLQKALDALRDAQSDTDPTTFKLSPQALAWLSEANFKYNSELSSGRKLPGVALREALSLDGAISLYNYDQGGLQFQLYAPVGSKAGDVITLNFQAYKLDGSLSDKVFSYQYTLKSTLSPTESAYTGEAISLDRFVRDPNFALRLTPVTGTDGITTLQSIAELDDQVGRFRVSIEGVTQAGTYQDFKLNFSPISIQNGELFKEASTFVKAGESVTVRVVLDQGVRWNAAATDADPTLAIAYLDKDGETKTKTASIAETGSGNVLTFNFEFDARDNANGFVTVPANALSGALRNLAGNLISASALNGLVNTEFDKELLFVDTVAPPAVQLTRDALATPGVDAQIDPSSPNTATFIKTLTPEFSIRFSDADGQNPSDTLPAYEGKPVTVQLFAYKADGRRGPDDVVIAEISVAPGPGVTGKFTADTYKATWTGTDLDLDGQAYKFYAKVLDEAGNENVLDSSDGDLNLWIDTQKPAAGLIEFDQKSADGYNGDPNQVDEQIRDTTPTFKVSGEAGSVVSLYTVGLNPDGTADGSNKVKVGEVLIPGSLGTGLADTLVTAAALAEGRYHFATTVTDKAGNESALSPAVALRIKTTVDSAVALSIEDAPSSGFYRAGQQIRIKATFNEEVYLKPGVETAAYPYIVFKNASGTGGDLRATYVEGQAQGSTTLVFSYTVPEGGLADSGMGQFLDFAAGKVTVFNVTNVVDVVGNALSATLPTVTPPAPPLAIDTTPPVQPEVVLDASVIGVVSKDEAAAGVVKVTAEAGSTLLITFTNPADGKTLTKQNVLDAAASSFTFNLSEDELTRLGVAGSNSASLAVSVTATDKAGNVSQASSLLNVITLDTLAPVVSSAAVDAATPAVIAHRGTGAVQPFKFNLSFNEDLATPATKSNFALVDSSGNVIGEVLQVEAGTGGSYAVTVRPQTGFQGNAVLKLFATASDNPLKDAAGNSLKDALLNTDGLQAQQSVDTVRPTVLKVEDDVQAAYTNGDIAFTVTFSEAVRALNDVSTSFVASNASVAAVERVSETQYRVIVRPTPGLADATVELSIQPSATGAFVDLHGNAIFGAGAAAINLASVGGTQNIDTVRPDTAVLALDASVQDTASKGEAMAALLTVTAEADSSVVLTFTHDGKQVQKTVAGTGAAARVSLTADELSALGLAAANSTSLRVSAVVTDRAGNQSPASEPLTINVDTLAPSVISVTDNIAGTAGSQGVVFTVTFSEALAADPTVDDFALTDVSMGSITSVTRVVGTNAYQVTVTPNINKQGNVALLLKGGALADLAGNNLLDADLRSLNTQAVDTVAATAISVVDNVTADYANASSSVVFTVRFDKALSALLTSDQLKAAFAATNGSVVSVEPDSSYTQYKVTVAPTLGVADGVMSLSIVADKLIDALGNQVAARSLESLNTQKIDTTVPLAPGLTLDAASDSGIADDLVTSVTRPTFKLTDLEVGATLSIVNGDQVLYTGLITSTEMSVQLANPLRDGSYNIRAFQTDPRGNVSNSTSLGTLLIQSAAPGALQDLVFDAEQDVTVGGVVLDDSTRDYRTDRPTPTFNFTGGTVGSTAVLFLDKNKNGLMDEGEELGRSLITESNRSVSVSPFNALTRGSYGPLSDRGIISVFEINAAGVAGPSSALKLNGVLDNSGSTNNYTEFTVDPAAPEAITISSAETARVTNAGTLRFEVTAGGQEGGVITVIADATVAGVLTAGVVIGTAAAPVGAGLVDIDVSKLASQGAVVYTNFKAYQSYAGEKSAEAAVTFTDTTVNTTGITLDRAAPTVTSIVADKATLLQDEVSIITITFAEAVQGLTAADIDGLGAGSLSEPTTADGGTTWTATYTPATNSSTAVSLSVKPSATIKDLAGNAMVAASAPLALTINTQPQLAPTVEVPAPILDGGMFVGTAFAISGSNTIKVDDSNNNLAKVELSVTQGTLSIADSADMAGVSITGSGTASVVVTATGTGVAARDALNAALAKLSFTAAEVGSATLTIVSHDTAVGSFAAHSTTATLTLNNIALAPVAPVNEVAAQVDQSVAAIVAGKAFGFTGSNLLKVSDINDDLQSFTLTVGQGSLAIESTEGVTINGGGTGTLTVTATGSGTAATTALNAALAKLVYTANGSAATTDSLTLVTKDSQGLTASSTLALDVKAAPVTPVNTAPATGPEGIIAGTPKAITGISVADGDHNIASVTLTVLQGSLAIASTEGVNIAGGGTGTLTLTATGSGSAATAALNAALAKLVYTATSTYSGADTLSIVTTDSTGATLSGPLSDSDSVSLTVNAAPQPPVNTLPSAPGGIITGQTFSFSGTHLISVDDADNNLASITLSVTNGKLNVTAVDGVTVSANDSSTVTLTGTDKVKLNEVLASLQYTGNAGYAGPEKLTVTSTDSNSAAMGGPATDTDALDFVVYAAPIAPENTVPSTAPQVIAGTSTAITGVSVADGDNNLASVTLTVTNGTLSLTAVEGVTLSGNASSSVTLTGVDKDKLNQVLASLLYTANAGYVGAETLTVESKDSTSDALGGAKLDTDVLNFTVLATPVNVLNAPTTLQFGTMSFSGLSVSDADDNLTQVVLTVTHGTLSSSASTGVASSDAGKTLTLTGSLTDINAALAGLSYNFDQQAGQAGVKLSMVSTDASGLSKSDEVVFDVPAADNVSPTGDVTVSGNALIGAQLSADTSALEDDNGLGTFSYQWFRTAAGGSAALIDGATASTYTVVSADFGTTLSVKVSYTDGAGHSESLTSAPSAAAGWPESLNFGSAVLSFLHDAPNNFDEIDDGTTSTNSKFIALQGGKFYVLDVDGDNAITQADKTTFLMGMSDGARVTSASGATFQLLNVTDWAALKTSLADTLPSSWASSADAGSASYWTRDSQSAGTHQVYTFASGMSEAVSNNATALDVSKAYHYNVFQVL